MDSQKFIAFMEAMRNPGNSRVIDAAVAGFSAISEASGIPGGLADGMPDSDFDPEQLDKGIDVELEEHTTGKGKKAEAIAKDIAKDHLSEIPDYYDRLGKMEKAAGVKD